MVCPLNWYSQVESWKNWLRSTLCFPVIILKVWIRSPLILCSFRVVSSKWDQRLLQVVCIRVRICSVQLDQSFWWSVVSDSLISKNIDTSWNRWCLPYIAACSRQWLMRWVHCARYARIWNMQRTIVFFKEKPGIGLNRLVLGNSFYFV